MPGCSMPRTDSLCAFVNGKQKRVLRPELIEGLPVDGFIARDADLIWQHQNELWKLMMTQDDT